MAKRFLDILVSFAGLLLLSPLIFLFMLLVWLQDFGPPLYISRRVRRSGVTFDMYKLRSMVVNADKKGGASTSASDKRLTLVGIFLRKLKLDEVPQLWNVLRGDMSLVGPRPQVPRDVDLYTVEELNLFNVRPGITDFSSIIFSDEADILAGSVNPDLTYNQLIRPWKSRLGLFYAQNSSFFVDLRIILLTLLSLFSRPLAIQGVVSSLHRLGASDQIVRVASRKYKLVPFPPPGSSSVEDRW